MITMELSRASRGLRQAQWQLDRPPGSRHVLALPGAD